PSMLSGAGLAASSGQGLFAFNLGGVAGAVVGAMAIARFGSKPTMLTMAGAAAASAFALRAMPVAAGSDPLPMVVMLGVTGCLINGVQTTMSALAAHAYPTAVRATGVGSAVAFGRIGGIATGYVGAFALEWGGSRAFFGFMGASMLVCLAALAS